MGARRAGKAYAAFGVAGFVLVILAFAGLVALRNALRVEPVAAAIAHAAPEGTVRGTTERVTYGIDHVTDGDTVVLRNGQRVRLVQIDTPETAFGRGEWECYGPQASAWTKRILPIGTKVRLMSEPATDRVDRYGRLLRYVIRARDGLNVNLELVRVGAAAPYFYEGRRGVFARSLEELAERARALRLGLWGACPHTPYDPYRGVATRR